MTDLRNISGSPLRIRDDATSEQLGDAMGQRHKMMAAIMDVVTSYITGQEITDDMRDQLGEAAELLNEEIDAMERILVEH